MRPRSFRRAFSPPPLLPLDFAGDEVSEVCTTNLALDWVVHRLVSVGLMTNCAQQSAGQRSALGCDGYEPTHREFGSIFCALYKIM